MRYTRYSLLLSMLFAWSPGFSQNQNPLSLSAEQRQEKFQKAVLYRGEGNYDMAIQQLDAILLQRTDDAEALLLKGELHTQNQQFKEAVAVYGRLLPMQYKHTIALINLSYVLFMNNKPKEALSYASEAFNIDKTNNAALINYFNALLWNSKTKHATQIIHTYEDNLEPDQVLVMKARLYTTSGNFVDGLANYESLVSIFPNVNYVKEYVEVLLAKKQIHSALRVMQSYNDIFPEKENLKLKRKLQEAQLQQLKSGFSYSKDAGQNVRMIGHIQWRSAQKKNYQYEVRSEWSTLNTAANNKVHSGALALHLQTRLGTKLKGQTQIQMTRIDLDQEREITTILGHQSIQYQPHDRQMIGLFLNSGIMDDNSILLGKNIRSQEWGIQAHYMTNKRNGIYLQSSVSKLSDGNKKWQMFGSLYQILRNNPLVKIGVNTALLQYKNNRMEDYFSPEETISTEFFGEYANDNFANTGLRWYVQMASGMQRLHGKDWNPVFRLNTTVSYHTKSLGFLLKFQTSNIATNTPNGYRFMQIEKSISYRF
ncbi:MAG: hypothetical protein KJP00_06925 [Bacteroidia bacterium]|nr:hypothetical protein [Bacteroidia bacterium]